MKRATGQWLGAACLALTAGCAAPTVTLPPVSGARLLVVSDIDDTVRDTRVTVAPSSHVKNPLLLVDFLRPWSDVRGMAALYRQWERQQGAVFAYVSGGPPIYRAALQKFLVTHDFPSGPILLNRRFPIGTPEHKQHCVAMLLAAHPRARVILIGDSGEHDPAIFSGLLAQHSERIAGIFIRRVTDDAEATVSQLDRRVPGGKWIVFREPSEITAARFDAVLKPRARRW